MTDGHLVTGRRAVPTSPPVRRSARARIKAGPAPAGWLKARVLKAGHGRIFTGQMIDGSSATYEWGDEFCALEATARAHEDRGLAEIVE
jgi:hypothetical protein